MAQTISFMDPQEDTHFLFNIQYHFVLCQVSTKFFSRNSPVCTEFGTYVAKELRNHATCVGDFASGQARSRGSPF